MIAVSFSLVVSIGATILVVATALIFPLAQKRGVAAFRPREATIVVPGTREEWLQRCCDGLTEHRHFSIVDVSEYECEIKAKYRVVPIWVELTVSLSPEGAASTRINATVTVLPNLFTLITTPENRVLVRFARAVGAEDRAQSHNGVRP